MRIATFPFYVAADWVGHRDADPPAGEMFFQGAIEIVGGCALGLARVVYSAAGVDEFSFAIENAKMRRSPHPISFRDLLGGVMKVKQENLCSRMRACVCGKSSST